MPDRPGPHGLAALAEEALERTGNHDALWFEGRWYRSGDLLERARRVGAGLARLGVRPGDRVVVLAANCPEVGVVYHAIWRAGAAITPALFLLSPEDLRHVLADSEAVALVATPELLPLARAAAEGVGTLRSLVVAGPAEPGAVTLEELEAEEPGPPVPRADDELAALLYTGGTTGRAKGVMLSHANLWHAGKAAHDAGYVPGIRRSLQTLPLAHSYGLLVIVVGLHAPEPGSAVLLRWFAPETFLELVGEHAVEISAVVPSMLHALLAQPLESYDLSSLRYLARGGAPLAPEVVEELRRRVPHVEVREGYGLTESSAIVSTNPPGAVRAGSVGPPVPGTEIRIVDGRDRELPAGEVGEICCRSPSVMLGYWRDPALTAEVTRGGWLHTGDLGFRDADGYLHVVDRVKDLIIRNGFNVFPRDVEDALLEHPAVSAAAVVGRPDDAHGEEVVAFVSLRDDGGLPPKELVAFARRRLGGHRYPREVRILPSVPLTPVGKVDRRSLRALLREGGAE
jgi:long-chain acyl-CoA synthetase